MTRIFFQIIPMLLLILPQLSVGQINESDTLKFQLKASISGIYQTGNVELLSQRGMFDFAYAPVRSFEFKSQNSNRYQEFYKRKADNEVYSRNYLYYKPGNRVYPYAIAFITSNYRLKVDVRSFAGAGLTLQVIQKENHLLKASANLVYEQTRFNGTVFNDSEYNGNDQISIWRGTGFLSGWDYLFDRRVRFTYEAYWQLAYNNVHNYRTLVDLGLDFPLKKGFAFTTVYTYIHENVTVLNVKKTDNILTFGVNYRFWRHY